MSLKDDREFYLQLKPDLLEKDLEGYYVLVKDAALVDVYPSYEEAYAAAVKQFGTAQVYITQVQRVEPVETTG